MESFMVVAPAYEFGKIKNKYIILECLGYSGKSQRLARMLHGANRNLRGLLIKNLKAFIKISVKAGKASLALFDHTA
jgi:hypothetical protein